MTNFVICPIEQANNNELRIAAKQAGADESSRAVQEAFYATTMSKIQRSTLIRFMKEAGLPYIKLDLENRVSDASGFVIGDHCKPLATPKAVRRQDSAECFSRQILSGLDRGFVLRRLVLHREQDLISMEASRVSRARRVKLPALRKFAAVAEAEFWENFSRCRSIKDFDRLKEAVTAAFDINAGRSYLDAASK